MLYRLFNLAMSLVLLLFTLGYTVAAMLAHTQAQHDHYILNAVFFAVLFKL